MGPGCIFFNLLHKEEDDDEEEIDPDEPAIFGSVECVNSVTALKTFLSCLLNPTKYSFSVAK